MDPVPASDFDADPDLAVHSDTDLYLASQNEQTNTEPDPAQHGTAVDRSQLIFWEEKPVRRRN